MIWVFTCQACGRTATDVEVLRVESMYMPPSCKDSTACIKRLQEQEAQEGQFERRNENV